MCARVWDNPSSGNIYIVFRHVFQNTTSLSCVLLSGHKTHLPIFHGVKERTAATNKAVADPPTLSQVTVGKPRLFRRLEAVATAFLTTISPS